MGRCHGSGDDHISQFGEEVIAAAADPLARVQPSAVRDQVGYVIVQLGHRLVERGEPGTAGPGELGQVSAGDLTVADDPLNGNVRVPGIVGPEFVPRVARELAAAGLITLADKGYTGAGGPVRTPYRGRGKPASQKEANRAHARLRAPGKRANAQLKTWHILRKLRCCPWRAAQIAKAIHVLQTRETTG